jgi:N utilization substance protein B
MARRPDRRHARRSSRLKAVQALYQIAMTDTTPEAVVMEFISHRLKETVDDNTMAAPDSAFFADLVRGTAAEQEDLDAMIAAVLKEGWQVERLEATLVAVLRAGTWELVNRHDIPVRATISEYTDIAGAFMGERETSMVSGVLNRIATELRPDEMTRPAPVEPADTADGSQPSDN